MTDRTGEFTYYYYYLLCSPEAAIHLERDSRANTQTRTCKLL